MAVAPDRESEGAAVGSRRLLSLDGLRGLTIAFMILVNNGGPNAYAPLDHARWNGFTPTDLVFPTFLFLVGISTVLSLESRLVRGAGRGGLLVHVLRRAVVLFLFGLLTNTFPLFHLDRLRFYGVLQRIAICYLVLGAMYLLGARARTLLAVFVTALVGYWILVRFVPVPGYGMPVRDVALLDPDGNLTAWLDRELFSPAHLYEHTRDPEGLLSTLPALGTAALGALTGLWLRSARPLLRKAWGIALAGVLALLTGGLWNLIFPLNKKLWTSSFVLWAGGWSLLLLALFLWLEDARATRRKRNAPDPPAAVPLLVFGTNAIAAYLFAELLQGGLSAIRVAPRLNVPRWCLTQIGRIIPDPHLASLAYALLFVAACWLAIYPLYRRRIFFKV